MSSRFFAFDFDGVIANSLPIALEEYGRICTEKFPRIPSPKNQADLAYVFPGPLRTSLRRFGLSDAESREFFDLHSEAMRRRAIEIELFTPLVDVLVKLPTEGFAIVTSAYSDAVRSIFATCGCAAFSKQVQVLGRELSLKKSEKFHKLANDNRIAVSNIVKIGDMVSDILYARESGVSVWSVGWGYHPLNYLAAFDPDEVFDTIPELYDRINGE